MSDEVLKQPVSYQDLVHHVREYETALAKAIISRHRLIFPLDQDIRYVVTQRNGRVKVRFEPQEVREPGFVDS